MSDSCLCSGSTLLLLLHLPDVELQLPALQDVAVAATALAGAAKDTQQHKQKRTDDTNTQQQVRMCKVW